MKCAPPACGDLASPAGALLVSDSGRPTVPLSNAPGVGVPGLVSRYPKQRARPVAPKIVDVVRHARADIGHAQRRRSSGSGASSAARLPVGDPTPRPRSPASEESAQCEKGRAGPIPLSKPRPPSRKLHA